MVAPHLVSDLYNPNTQATIDMDAKEFGFLISEAFHDCNDMDGPHWPTVARKVAEAAGIILTEAAR
ncbi:hypothetical protein ACLBW9_22575 [Methylobacterium mesophilicum]